MINEGEIQLAPQQAAGSEHASRTSSFLPCRCDVVNSWCEVDPITSSLKSTMMSLVFVLLNSDSICQWQSAIRNLI